MTSLEVTMSASITLSLTKPSAKSSLSRFRRSKMKRSSKTGFRLLYTTAVQNFWPKASQ